MSHDQKPGKVRVVGGQAAAPSRRSDDSVLDDPASVLAVATQNESTKNGPGQSKLLLAALFMTGCAIGGAALPLVRGA